MAGFWVSTEGNYAAEGQRVLRALIDGRLNLTPIEGTYYRFEGVGTLAPVLTGVLPHVPHNLASPTPASWNHIVEWLGLLDGLRRAS